MQAQDLLERNIDRKVNSVHSFNDSNPEATKTIPAKQLKASEIIAVANELYSFVEQK